MQEIQQSSLSKYKSPNERSTSAARNNENLAQLSTKVYAYLRISSWKLIIQNQPGTVRRDKPRVINNFNAITLKLADN
jgi:hypothetical protein